MLFPKKNEIFKTLDDILLAVGSNSYAFSVHRPALQKRQGIFERQERIYGINNDLHIVILNVISSK